MRWPAEAVWQQVAPLLPGFTVEVLPELDSTNTELMRRVRAGRPEPVLLVAERQTAGRGRIGRAWEGGAPGGSLMFSLGLPMAPAEWSGLSLAIGVSVAEALHPAVRLKWPNDLWVDARKLGGILVETAALPGSSQRYAIAGIGVNIEPQVVAGASTPPCALRELLPGADPGSALLAIAAPLVQAVQAFEAGGFAPFQARFQARDLLAGRPVRLSDGTAGTAAGVNGSGALLVHTAAGLTAVTSAEVSVRPA